MPKMVVVQAPVQHGLWLGRQQWPMALQ